ncbi:MAG: MFS transporter [Anaerolineales bacterium]|nr:MFS transporter [Anaerolineales bacterium]
MNLQRLFWPFSLYLLIFAGVATFRPYMVLYYQSLGFAGAQIGLLTGIAPLVPLVTLPLLTALADRTGRYRLIMSLALLSLVAGLVVFPYLRAFIPLFVLAIFLTVAFSPVGALASSASLHMLGNNKDQFGRVRLGGTLGFSLLATVAGALVEQHGLKIAFWGAAVIYVLAFLVSQKLDHGGEESNQNPVKSRMGEMLRNPHFGLFFVLSLAGGIAFSTINTYFFPYMRDLGADESTMGLALTIGTVAELPVLFFINQIIRRSGAYPVVVFSIAMTALRFLLLGVASNPMLVLVIQLLNGFNQPLLSVAGVIYVNELAPAGLRASAQGLFNVAYGAIGSAIGGFVGGLLFDSLGANDMYLAFGLFVSMVLLGVSLVRHALPSAISKTSQDIT